MFAICLNSISKEKDEYLEGLFAHESCQRFPLRLLWDANQHSGGIIVLDFDRAADYLEVVSGSGLMQASRRRKSKSQP